jgi:hypothetical protein
MLGDLAIAMQTLASTTIQNEAFNPQEFLVQVVDLSDRTKNLASDLYMEAPKLLTEHQQVTHFECVSNGDNDVVDHDPGKRRLKLSDNQKKHLITLGPCQPQLFFQKRKNWKSIRSSANSLLLGTVNFPTWSTAYQETQHFVSYAHFFFMGQVGAKLINPGLKESVLGPK